MRANTKMEGLRREGRFVWCGEKVVKYKKTLIAAPIKEDRHAGE